MITIQRETRVTYGSSGFPDVVISLVFLEISPVGFSTWAAKNNFLFDSKTLYSSSEEKWVANILDLVSIHSQIYWSFASGQ